MTKLRPSWIRLSVSVMGIMAIAFLLASLQDRTHINLPLIIPFTFVPLFVWFAFVPRELEYSPTHLHIRTWIFGDLTFPWSDLNYYSAFNYHQQVCLLQFGGRQAFQICPYAYEPSAWKDFMTFLKANFPDRKADYWTGPHGYRWPWRK